MIMNYAFVYLMDVLNDNELYVRLLMVTCKLTISY